MIGVPRYAVACREQRKARRGSPDVPSRPPRLETTRRNLGQVTELDDGKVHAAFAFSHLRHLYSLLGCLGSRVSNVDKGPWTLRVACLQNSCGAYGGSQDSQEKAKESCCNVQFSIVRWQSTMVLFEVEMAVRRVSARFVVEQRDVETFSACLLDGQSGLVHAVQRVEGVGLSLQFAGSQTGKSDKEARTGTGGALNVQSS